jgi:hypothetical protein
MMSEQDAEYVGSTTLIVLGDDLDPDQVSAELSLVPSQCWRKGQASLHLADGTTRLREGKYECGGWKLLVAPEQKDRRIEAQLEFWVELLQSRTAALKRLRLRGFECALDLFVTSSETASIFLSSQLQKEVTALGLDVRLLFWASSESEQAAAGDARNART